MKIRINYPQLAAEFVVIVVGVAIALATDRWNQDRTDQERAESYRSRLLIELKADQDRLIAEVDAVERSMFFSVDLLDLVQGKAVPEESVYQLYYRCARNAPLPYAGGATFQEMQSVGDLGLIEEELRQGLFDYYGFVESQLLRMQDTRQIGRNPMTEAAFNTGAWLPGDRQLSDEEFLTRLQEYPGIGEIVNSCVAFHNTSGNMIEQWLIQLSDLLELLRAPDDV
jgi:hypothetical protein